MTQKTKAKRALKMNIVQLYRQAKIKRAMTRRKQSQTASYIIIYIYIYIIIYNYIAYPISI